MGAGLTGVLNISEGRDRAVLARLQASVGAALLDLHTDAHHHRSVFTLGGPDVAEAARVLAGGAIRDLDLRLHEGVHPRLGVLDVVPFVPVDGGGLDRAIAAREHFGAWLAGELGVPGFRYGPERALPEIRRRAFSGMAPDWGGPGPHPSAGATCVGARGWLVAYNVWLDVGVDGESMALARRIADTVRGRYVRALGLAAGRPQVSMNLVEPRIVGPMHAFDAVAGAARALSVPLGDAELVGLLPTEVLTAIPRRRWRALGLSNDATIEARLSR